MNTHRYQTFVFDLNTLIDQDTDIIDAFAPRYALSSKLKTPRLTRRQHYL